jgi:hypothetical protein
VRRRLALQALKGVGGMLQWEEDRPMAYHIRRRLTDAEAQITGPVRDLRRSAEGQERFERVRASLPAQVVELAMEEIL